jgi:hypothetical protein
MSGTATERKRWKVWIGRPLLVLIGLLVVGELVARFYLGLGDPPLSVPDSEIEYLFKPSQEVSRFGNRVAYNAYSMRSDDFPKEKQNEQSLRIMVLGDSVINGGSRCDQSEIATELLKKTLADALRRPVTVGNISAGSWGPGNQLAYVQRYGLFDADVVVLVISSHDAGDVPTFKPIVGISPAFPEHKPVLALQEAVMRYLPRYLPIGGGKEPGDPTEVTNPTGAIDDLKELITIVRDQGVDLLIAQHPEKGELSKQKREGFSAIASTAEAMGVPTIDLAPFYEEAIAAGNELYRDKIHPNAKGQRVIAEALQQAIIERLGDDVRNAEQ